VNISMLSHHPIFVDTIGPNDAGSISIIHFGGTHA